MKISLNEIKKYVKIPDEIDTAELVRRIGARLVEVEEAIDLAPKYAKAYIVKVVECEAIPGTHLHLCQIDAGAAGDRVQVVCGAPNVRKGMLAVWLAPGAIVPQTYGEENFKLGARKLRGYESNGMLAGLDELDLGDDHSGIVEIDPAMDLPGAERKVQAGDSLAEAFELNDVILDIENKSLTHRPDTFGLIGFAREVAGILGIAFAEPEMSGEFDKLKRKINGVGGVNKLAANENSGQQTGAIKNEQQMGAVEVVIENEKLCPRYSCAVVEMADATEKPKYLTPDAVFLAKAGMRTIDKIVDLTNILMLKTGQPLHAFDYDKFVQVGGGETPKVVVRAARPGEELQLLDGSTIKCTPDDILITANDTAVALAGAMGGASTEIDASTKKVLLESATFSLYNLRKTQMQHGIFSEAITRFTKGQPASQTLRVLGVAAKQLGETVQSVTDVYPGKERPIVVKITTHEINQLLGTKYSKAVIVKTLENVGFEVRETDTKTLEVVAPDWRTDIHIPEDVIEEVGRLNGFDNIPKTLPMRPFVGAREDNLLRLKRELRRILSDKLGAHEILTYTFTNKKLQQVVGEEVADSYEIVNSISPDLQVMRQSITPSLLEKVQLNQKANYKNFALYEMNQVTRKSLGLTADKVPEVQHHLAVVTTGDYYTAKALLEEMLAELKIAAEVTDFAGGPAYYEPLHAANVVADGEILGYLGEVRLGVGRRLKLAGTVSGFELDLQQILKATQTATLKQHQISKFPTVERDITLRVASEVRYIDLRRTIEESLAREQLIFTVEPASIFQKEPETKNISFRITFASLKKTLASVEISDIMEKVAANAGKLGAEVI